MVKSDSVPSFPLLDCLRVAGDAYPVAERGSDRPGPEEIRDHEGEVPEDERQRGHQEQQTRAPVDAEVGRTVPARAHEERGFGARFLSHVLSVAGLSSLFRRSDPYIGKGALSVSSSWTSVALAHSDHDHKDFLWDVDLRSAGRPKGLSNDLVTGALRGHSGGRSDPHSGSLTPTPFGW